ncbi:MAG: DUF6356 family protein [Candidatus Puniceispirillum sp.]
MKEPATMLNKIFFAHPKQVNETYFEHGKFALTFAYKLFLAATAAAVHAFVPSLFERTASRIVADLYQKTHNRN